MNLYVGEDDGKLHFVNAGGADSVIPFNKGISVPLWHYQMNGSYSTIEFDVSDYSTLSIGGNDASGTCALQVICDGVSDGTTIGTYDISQYASLTIRMSSSVYVYGDMTDIVLS